VINVVLLSNKKNSMVSYPSTFRSSGVNSSVVKLERSLNFKSYRNNGVRKPLGQLGGSFLGLGLELSNSNSGLVVFNSFTGLVSSSVRVLSSGSKSVVSGVLERWHHESSLASGVRFVSVSFGSAVYQFLFGKVDSGFSVGSLGENSFEGTYSRESPT